MRSHRGLMRSPAARWAVLVAVGSLSAVMLTGVSAPAQAAAPSNDAWENAIDVTLPFSTTVDTTEATKDAVNPGTSSAHSVWYHIKLHHDGPLLVSTQGSNYELVLRLYHAKNATDTPDLWTRVGVDTGWGLRYPAGMVRQVKAGENYYVMISNHSDDNGGLAHLVVRRPAKITYSLAKYGVLDRVDGSAVLHGTLQSTHPVKVGLLVTLRQLVGSMVVQGSGSNYNQKASKTAVTWKLRVAARHAFTTGPVRVVYSRLRVHDAGVQIGTFHFHRGTVTLR